jgi:hypothetical protein
MALTNGGIVMIILFGIGLVLLFSAIARKHAGPLKHINPVLGAVLGVALIIPGFYWGVAPNLPGFEQYGGTQPQTIVIQDDDTTPTTVLAVPTFELDPGVNTTGFNLNTTLNSAKTEFTFPYRVTSLDNTGDKSGTTANVFARVHWDITPVAPSGADSTTLCAIYYSITPTNYDVNNDERYLVIRANDVLKTPMINWTMQVKGNAGKVSSGSEGEKSTSMLLTDTAEIWLDITFSNTTIAKYLSTLSGMDFTVTFRNADYTWTKSYTITLIKILDSCSNT